MLAAEDLQEVGFSRLPSNDEDLRDLRKQLLEIFCGGSVATRTCRKHNR